MRPLSLAACLLIANTPAALAQNLDHLRAAMDALPLEMLTSPSLTQFVDVEAVLALPGLEGKPLGPEHLQRLMLGAQQRPIEALGHGGRDAWETHSGVPLSEVKWVAGYGFPPETVALWGLGDEAAVTTLGENLRGRGFVDSTIAGVLGNGEPLKLDLSNRQPADPWHSPVGAAAFAAPRGNIMVEAGKPELAAAVANGTDSAGQSPVVATALAGLEQSVGDGWVVGALLLSPMLGLKPAVPKPTFDRQNPDLDALRKEMEAQAATAADGIPPWFGGFVADVQLDTPAVAISLSYPDCTVAQAAADGVAAKLQPATPAGAKITAATAEGVGGLCAATVAVVMPTAGPEALRLLMGFLQGDPGALRIGLGS